MKIITFYAISFTLAIPWTANAHKQKVCIIGAGMSGLVSVKRLAEHTDDFEPIVFEKNSDVGGLWIYTDSTTVDEHGLPVHSSVYKNLRTNGPKELMSWPDYKNFTDEFSSVYHYKVLQYLRNYTVHFNLRQYIKFNTLVENVTLIKSDRENCQQEKWLVKTKNLDTEERKETICNIVIICNGHYAKPKIPVIPGIEKFRGTIIHSHIYRKPELFANKTVAVLGDSVSGIDISLELSTQAKKIYISHRHDKITSKLPTNIEQVPGVVKANGNELILSNGSSIIADAFIYCTGYLYDFRFLDKSNGMEINESRVFPLYKQMINVEHPSMIFIGHPTANSIFMLPYVQSRYIVAFLQGKLELPSYEEMIKDANTLPPGAKEGKYHDLNDYQFTYQEQLAKAAGFEPPPSYFKDGLKLYKDYRKTHLMTYKNVLFKLNPNGTFYLENTEEDNA